MSPELVAALAGLITATGAVITGIFATRSKVKLDDIAKLLGAFARLRDAGHSLLVIEHNLDVIAASDWVIDLGPEGGVKGGEIVAVGTPEDVAKEPRSFTGSYLRPLLERYR